MLALNLCEAAWLQTGERFLDAWYQWQQVRQFIGVRCEYKNSNWQLCEILLILEILIGCDECVELLGGERQELAILYSAPTHFDYSLDRMSRQ